MQGAEDRRLRRMNNTPQGPAFAVGYGRGKREIEGNAADDILMVDQGWPMRVEEYREPLGRS